MWRRIGRRYAGRAAISAQAARHGTSYTQGLARVIHHRFLSGSLLFLLPALSGCLMHTHVVQHARVPTVVLSAEADQLVRTINQQSTAVQGLSATVELHASVGGERKGKVTDYTSLSGYILLRQPEMAHVIGLVPIVRTHAFELVSDGKTFKLLIPSQNKVIEGSNAVTPSSTHGLENMRPQIFFDAMILKSIRPDELVTLTKSSAPRPDISNQQMVTDPEYDLTVVRRKANSQELIPERVIRFSRQDLLPYQEDIYDQAGAIETQVMYGPYQQFDTAHYPGTITIKRPLEEYQIVITVQKLALNPKLTDAQFEIKIPDGTTIQKLP